MDGFDTLLNELSFFAEEEDNQEMRRRVRRARLAYALDALRVPRHRYAHSEKIWARFCGISNLPLPSPYLRGAHPKCHRAADY